MWNPITWWRAGQMRAEVQGKKWEPFAMNERTAWVVVALAACTTICIAIYLGTSYYAIKTEAFTRIGIEQMNCVCEPYRFKGAE